MLGRVDGYLTNVCLCVRVNLAEIRVTYDATVFQVHFLPSPPLLSIRNGLKKIEKLLVSVIFFSRASTSQLGKIFDSLSMRHGVGL